MGRSLFPCDLSPDNVREPNVQPLRKANHSPLSSGQQAFPSMDLTSLSLSTICNPLHQEPVTMKPEFALYSDRDRYFIRHADSLQWDYPLLLGGGTPDYTWSTDLSDAKPFQYRKDAMNFMLQIFPSWNYIIIGMNCKVKYSLKEKVLSVEPTTSGIAKLGLAQLTSLLSLIEKV